MTPVEAISVLALVISAVMFAIGIIVLRARPDLRANRWLATYLVISALQFATPLLAVFSQSYSVSYWLWMANVALASFSIAYLGLVSTLPSPMSAWLRKPIMQGILVGLIMAVPVAILIRPELAFDRLIRLDFVWPYLPEAFGVITPLAWKIQIPIYLFGPVVAFDAWRRLPPNTLQQRQARSFFQAFVIADVYLIAFSAMQTFNPGWFGSVANMTMTFFVASMTYLWVTIILGYAILRNQMFDVELKLKWTISRGTVASIFLAVFFVVSLGASEFIIDQLGYAVGAVATGLLLLVMRPLQKLGERVANAAMPGVHDTPEYHAARRDDIYRAAVDGALQDGEITSRERDVLAALADSLGLSAGDARIIEKSATTLPKISEHP